MIKPVRILAFDISLGQPGAALIEVRNGQATIIDKSNIKTTTKDSIAVRTSIVYAWAVHFIERNRSKGFDFVVRELFQGRTWKQNAPVFAAWSAVDQALNVFELAYTDEPISPGTHFKAVTGNGKATKQEVAEAVRKWTSFEGGFASDDESDACSLALYKAVKEGLI
ncbi:TPA: crossover junction endodeoxyribonuclease RuvC [Listeria monocytogenes]|nr:crossover junction endodeoxyribonuclease RuvC [Listeria monocytogenes]HEM0754871.1 crossover junction endodeoxyribonuclease RuvC [Listeria monocytogenes]HEM1463215.1 crossover junction endodeoxyribonuclease RuvC [Listeria monocytogenes]